ncbi:hypothetical protein [Levilactobacillus enshiensis]|uniref:hypothetical protein n=1 Tax=Levilactobacillus enshiensis TaxID=2590213 RepID=UPI00117B3AA3|nr:hypothetical protein [Levilactobacillus enshiensis]
MADNSRTIMTDAGFTLEAQLRANKTNMQFTRASISTKNYFEVDDEVLAKLSTLDDVQQDGQVTEVQVVDDSTVHVQVNVDQTQSPNDYQMLSAGLYAKDSDGNEILYGVTALQDPVFVHKDDAGSYLGFGIDTKVGRAANVTIVVNPANMVTKQVFDTAMQNYYTKAEMDAKLQDLDDYAGLSEANNFEKQQTFSQGAVDGAGNAYITAPDAQKQADAAQVAANKHTDDAVAPMVKSADTSSWQKNKITNDNGAAVLSIMADGKTDTNSVLLGLNPGVYSTYIQYGAINFPGKSSARGLVIATGGGFGNGTFFTNRDDKYYGYTFVMDGDVIKWKRLSDDSVPSGLNLVYNSRYTNNAAGWNMLSGTGYLSTVPSSMQNGHPGFGVNISGKSTIDTTMFGSSKPMPVPSTSVDSVANAYSIRAEALLYADSAVEAKIIATMAFLDSSGNRVGYKENYVDQSHKDVFVPITAENYPLPAGATQVQVQYYAYGSHVHGVVIEPMIVCGPVAPSYTPDTIGEAEVAPLLQGALHDGADLNNEKTAGSYSNSTTWIKNGPFKDATYVGWDVTVSNGGRVIHQHAYRQSGESAYRTFWDGAGWGEWQITTPSRFALDANTLHRNPATGEVVEKLYAPGGITLANGHVLNISNTDGLTIDGKPLFIKVADETTAKSNSNTDKLHYYYTEES